MDGSDVRSVNRQTFTRQDRIREKRDFQRLRKDGFFLTDGMIALVILPTDTGVTRLGIAVPKRIGGAAVRNRIKRLIREVFRLNRNVLPHSVDLLVIARKKPEPLSFTAFRDRILALAGTYRPPKTRG